MTSVKHSTANQQPSDLPLLSVTRGKPNAEELAALTAVVLALQAAATPEPAKQTVRNWARRARLHLPPKPGAGAWRRSGF